jgi:hypothetical protein
MKKDNLKDTAFTAIVELLNAFDVVKAELTAEKISPAKIIKLLDYYARELKDVRKTFEGLVE